MAAEVLYRDLIATQDIKGSMAATPDKSTAKSGHIRTPRLMMNLGSSSLPRIRSSDRRWKSKCCLSDGTIAKSDV